MTINKENLELLLTKYISQGIKLDNKNDYWGELLIDLHEDNKFINVHFKYFEEGLTDTYVGTMEFTLKAGMSLEKIYLKELGEKTKININCLYNIINILNDL